MKGLFAVERLKKLNIVHVYCKQYYHLHRSTTMQLTSCFVSIKYGKPVKFLETTVLFFQKFTKNPNSSSSCWEERRIKITLPCGFFIQLHDGNTLCILYFPPMENNYSFSRFGFIHLILLKNQTVVHQHCVKSVYIRSFSGLNAGILNMNLNKSECGHFSRCVDVWISEQIPEVNVKFSEVVLIKYFYNKVL